METFLHFIDNHPSYTELIQRFHIYSDWYFLILTASMCIDTEHLTELFSRQFPNVKEQKWKGHGR